MRTPEEVNRVHSELGEQGLGMSPYILKYEAGNQRLVFFGSVHSDDINNPQFKQLEQEWQQFLALDGQKILVHERDTGGQVSYEDPIDAVLQQEESGYEIYLAAQSGVSALTGEPTHLDEIRHLKSAGFSEAAIMTYFLGRQFSQWQRSDRNIQPSWRDYALMTINGYNQVTEAWESPLKLEQVIEWFEQEVDQEFNTNDVELMSRIADPTTNEVSKASGDYRDIFLLEKIKLLMDEGKSVFIVYGSSHAIKLELDLKLLAEEVSNPRMQA